MGRILRGCIGRLGAHVGRRLGLGCDADLLAIAAVRAGIGSAVRLGQPLGQGAVLCLLEEVMDARGW